MWEENKKFYLSSFWILFRKDVEESFPAIFVAIDFGTGGQIQGQRKGQEVIQLSPDPTYKIMTDLKSLGNYLSNDTSLITIG